MPLTTSNSKYGVGEVHEDSDLMAERSATVTRRVQPARGKGFCEIWDGRAASPLLDSTPSYCWGHCMDAPWCRDVGAFNPCCTCASHQGSDCGPVAARVCHAGDSLLVLSPADVRVVGAGVSRSDAAERGEVLVLHA